MPSPEWPGIRLAIDKRGTPWARPPPTARDWKNSPRAETPVLESRRHEHDGKGEGDGIDEDLQARLKNLRGN